MAAEPAVPAGFTHVRSEQDISEYRLDSNGLTVLLLPDHSAPAVSVVVTYNVGSRNESYGTTGATHLLEHLMFKGTRDHNKEAGTGFDQLLERVGSITNATTSQDRTNYFETVGPQDLTVAISLEADRLRNLRLREEDRRPEMTVVRNEYERGENSPAEALEKEIWATAYLAHPYHHSTIGWKSDFEKVPISRLRTFYDTFYWPNNAVVTISGDFDPAAALALVKQYYGAIPRAPHTIPTVYTEEPPQTGPRRVVVKRPGELGMVTIANKMPPATHPDYAPLSVLGEILDGGRNSRLYLALTDKNLTTGVGANPSFNRDPTLFLIEAQLATGAQHADIEQRILNEISRVQTDGVKPEEVAAAISKLTANTAYERDGSLARAMALSECIAAGDWRLYYGVDEAVRRVTADDVQRVAKKYLTEDQRVTGWFIPQNDKTNAAAGAVAEAGAAETALMPEAEHPPGRETAAKAKPPVTQASIRTASGDAKKSAAPVAVAKIAPRVVQTKTAGIDLLVCPTGVKDVVTIMGSLPAYDAKNPILGELTAEMLSRGTNKHDVRAIAALLDQVGAQINFEYEGGNLRFVARCLKADLPRVVGILAEELREPSFPDEEFEKLRQLKLAEAQQMREDTDSQADIAFRRTVFPQGHPLHRMTADERTEALKNATAAQVKAFHHTWVGPEHCTMVLVGDADAGGVQAIVGKEFSGWTGGAALPKLPTAEALKHPPEQTVEIPGKQSVSVVMGTPTGLHKTDADYLPLSVATSTLGHGFTSRLVSTVRDTEGLTYGINSGLSGGDQLDRAWTITATFNPALVKQGLESTRRELAAWRKSGITAAELDYRKSALSGEHRVRMATTTGLAETILETICGGLPLTWIDDYPSQVAALSLEQVNGAIRKYVDPQNLLLVKAGTLEGK
ncbi:MAG TPA: pitrilysin family protein [Pirellulales bacterium]|jgi:zinc protease